MKIRNIPRSSLSVEQKLALFDLEDTMRWWLRAHPVAGLYGDSMLFEILDVEGENGGFSCFLSPDPYCGTMDGVPPSDSIDEAICAEAKRLQAAVQKATTVVEKSLDEHRDAGLSATPRVADARAMKQIDEAVAACLQIGSVIPHCEDAAEALRAVLAKSLNSKEYGGESDGSINEVAWTKLKTIHARYVALVEALESGL